MALLLRTILLLFVTASTVAIGSNSIAEEEEFSEELLLKPLADRKVLAHFHFESTTPKSASFGRHHHLFPKAIAQLVQKYQIKEMELSFTQGRWNYEYWGGYDPISSSNAKPPGVELWAVFDVPLHEVDAMWKNLTHSLSGLFCASINFLESSTSYSSPRWSFRKASGKLRYGTLPREAVCTENLTPWLKLLPCRDKAGLSALMDRPSIYKGFYHSQRLHLISVESSSEGLDSSIVIEQTLTVVLQPSTSRNAITNLGSNNLQPSWSIGSLFGRRVSGQCVLAKSSNVYLLLEKGLVEELNSSLENDVKNWGKNVASDSLWSNPAFEISSSPSKVLMGLDGSHGSSLLYLFPVNNYSESNPFDLGLKWKFPVTWSTQQAPLQATRFLMGSGNERGSIAISLRSTELNKGDHSSGISDEKCKFQVDIFQVVPWYIKVYYHTLQIFVDGQPQAVSDVVENMHVSPSKDKVSPGLMEIILTFPCDVKDAALTLEFDKGFLHIDEYPPDANQGFDIPSAVIRFPNFHASMQFVKDDVHDRSSLLSKLQEKSAVQSYSEVLLVPLTTPDFSMPYNVITITCTVFALYFGSLLNVLRRRAGEEERLMKSKAGKSSKARQLLSKLYAKLRRKPYEPSSSTSQPAASSFSSFKTFFKIILVAGVAVGWQYYSKLLLFKRGCFYLYDM